MFSGLDRKQVVERRQRSVAWAWMKARGTVDDQKKATHAKLTSSVLLSSDCRQGEEISNWRDSLTALSHRSIAKQICDQFYDLSILEAWRGRGAEIAAAGRALGGALPSCSRSPSATSPQANPGSEMRQPVKRSLMTRSVLPDRDPPKSAILIQLRSKAA